MSTAYERTRMAESILGFEALRDGQGRIKIHRLAPDDGGGTYEVAGINDRYHPQDAARLADLINSGHQAQAEAEACEVIANYTDVALNWTTKAPVEAYLRDCAFNRGPGGAIRMLQQAVGAIVDGIVGSETRAAMAQRETDPAGLLNDLRAARETYERVVAHRDESSRYWGGLVSRWDKALAFALTFLDLNPDAKTKFAVGGAGVAEVQSERFSATDAVISASMTVQRLAAGATEEASPAAFVAPVLSPAPLGSPVALPALRSGMRGDMVNAWQSFLNGQGFSPGGLDGIFGDKTVAATKAFQAKAGLAVDGVAGRETMLAAMQLGFELIEEPASDLSGSNFPPRPPFPALSSTVARQTLFGRFDYTADPLPRDPEHIRVLGSWERDNIVAVAVPQLRRALGPAAPASMQFHRLAAAQLAGLWADWEQAGLLGRILSYDGSYNPRFIRGSTTELSNHAFGTAFDINEAFNVMGTRPALVGQRGSVRELAPAAYKRGFFWGGLFGARADGMHFEIALLQ